MGNLQVYCIHQKRVLTECGQMWIIKTVGTYSECQDSDFVNALTGAVSGRLGQPELDQHISTVIRNVFLRR